METRKDVGVNRKWMNKVLLFTIDEFYRNFQTSKADILSFFVGRQEVFPFFNS